MKLGISYVNSALRGLAMMVLQGRRAMPIRQFIRGELTSAEFNRLNVAYARSLRLLDLTDRNDPVSDIVAKKVVDVGTSGLTDPEEIAKAVVSHFLKTA
jgi:hypothetical protein